MTSKLLALLFIPALASAAPVRSIMESNKLVIAPSGFWTNQVIDAGFSNAVNSVVSQAATNAASATNVIIAPGPAISIVTNTFGQSFEVDFITNYTGVLSFLNGNNQFAGDGSLLTGMKGNQVSILFSGAGVTEITNADGSRNINIPGGTNSGGGLGTVTSVSVSSPSGIMSATGNPITGFGTISLSMVNQSANTFLGGPVSGGPGVPAFRSLNALDIPLLTVSKLTDAGTLAYSNVSAVVLTPTNTGTDGQVVSKTGGQNKWITPGAGSGTVTSVGVSAPSFMGVQNSPVTGSGVIALSFNSQSAKSFLSGPVSGVASAPTFRQPQVSDLSDAGTAAYTNATAFAQVAANNTFAATNTFVSVVYVTQMVVQTFYFATNDWPPQPATPGGIALWNSNGSATYLLTSQQGSLSWAATNKLGP